MKTKLITDVISNETNHTNDMFLQKWVKNIFRKCKEHGYKHFACLYVSNGADRPMVTIMVSLIIDVCMCVCVCVCVWCMHACMCV